MAFPQPMQVGHRAFAFAGWKRLEMEFMGQQIDRPIIRLAFALIRDEHFNGPIAFTPDPPTRIPPQQMAFVFEQHYRLAPLDRVPMRCQFFLSAARRA